MSAPQRKLTSEQRITAAQQHIVYDRLVLSVLMTMVTSLVFLAALLPLFPRQVLLAWFTMIQFVSVLRLGLWYWHRQVRPGPKNQALWSWRFMLGTILSALAWSYGAVELMPGAGDVSMALLVVMQLAAASVAVSSLAACLPAMCAFMIITLAPAGLILATSAGQIERLVGLTLFAAIVSLVWTGYQSNRSIRRLLEIELELSEAVMVTAEARANAEDANRTKSRFLATMSLQIRAPLNGVLGLTEVLQNSELTADQRRHMNMLRHSGVQLLDSVNDILDFSRMEGDEVQLLRQPVNVRDLIEDLAESWRTRIAMSEVAFEIQIGDNVPAVILSDAVRLRQIINNYLSNAVKFTHEGAVTLAVDLLDGKPGDEDALLRVRVTDTGSGIPADRIGRVFEAFPQVDDSGVRRAGGTGLGLAICRKLASLLGGEVGAASEPGKGSTFVFTLRAPVSVWRDAVSSPSPSGRYPAATRLEGRVLLVEGNSINLEVAGSMLSLLGVQFETAEDGQTAVDKALNGSFDAVLMDGQMPVIDGFHATATLRRRELRARNGDRMPIIALTANAFAEDRQHAAAAGMDAFLAKPVQLNQLCAVLARWLPPAKSVDGGSESAVA